MSSSHPSRELAPPRSWLANAGLLVGPCLAVGTYFALSASGMGTEARCTAAIVVGMATWWMTEAIPLAATALLPLVLFPLLPVYPQQPQAGEIVRVQPRTRHTAADSTTNSAGLAGSADLAEVLEVTGEEATVEFRAASGSAEVTTVSVEALTRTDKRTAFERAAAGFADRFIFLFLGGFLIALAIERWNLHRRIALITLLAFGTSPRMIIGGFMVATAGLSMWISNTACTVMMLPIAASVVDRLVRVPTEESEAGPTTTPVPQQERFATCLMLAVAYAASIGGLATLVGTPPNALLASFLSGHARPISFAAWFLFATPLTLILLGTTWWLLTRVIFRFQLSAISAGRMAIREELQQLGKVSAAEWVTLAVFLSTATLWILRKPLLRWEWLTTQVPGLSRLDDPIIALLGGLALFVLPVSFGPLRMAMNWETARRLPWGILLLFGGGLALADAVQASGLGDAIGRRVASEADLPLWVMVGLVTLLVVFLTEFTSNMATTSLFLPILFQVAGGMRLDGTAIPPEYLLIPATLAASLAFMLPVATPPNAIVFASNRVTIGQMSRSGLLLNLVGAIIVPPYVLWLGPWLLGF